MKLEKKKKEFKKATYTDFRITEEVKFGITAFRYLCFFFYYYATKPVEYPVNTLNTLIK